MFQPLSISKLLAPKKKIKKLSKYQIFYKPKVTSVKPKTKSKKKPKK